MIPSRRNAAVSIPDFRNLGVILRVILIAEIASFIALIAYSSEAGPILQRTSTPAPLFEVSLLLVVLVLFGLAPLLTKCGYRIAVAGIVLIAAVVPGAMEALFGWWVGDQFLYRTLKGAFVGACLSGLILAYFNWRQKILSPALDEARLMALQARIRPHFLFNSINTAVSLLRDNPRLAERVLMDMSELFRVSLAENRLLVPLADEIAHAQAYVEIEQLRLGTRLRMLWDCDDIPKDTLVPSLLLQPLLENAIHHGIERCAESGEVKASMKLRAGSLSIEIRNTLPDLAGHSPGGNRMAVENIRERLALLFDAEAQFGAQVDQGEFVVRIAFPAGRRRIPQRGLVVTGTSQSR